MVQRIQDSFLGQYTFSRCSVGVNVNDVPPVPWTECPETKRRDEPMSL